MAENEEAILLLSAGNDEEWWLGRLYGLRPGFYRVHITEIDEDTNESSVREQVCVGATQAVEGLVGEFDRKYRRREWLRARANESQEIGDLAPALVGMPGRFAKALRKAVAKVAHCGWRGNADAGIAAAAGAL